MNYPEKPETCKECIHCEICREDKRLPAFDENQEALCKAFKPKSRFVELPCEVDSGIYIVLDNEIYPAKVQKIELYKDTMTVNGICWNEKKEQWGDFLTPLCCFGETVFLSREDAEKALAERSNT